MKRFLQIKWRICMNEIIGTVTGAIVGGVAGALKGASIGLA